MRKPIAVIQWTLPEVPKIAQAQVMLARGALARRPGHLPLWIALGDALRHTDDPVATAAHWEAAIAGFPDEPGLRIKLAAARHQLGDFEGTIAALRGRAIADTGEAASFLLDAFVRLGRWDEAAVAAARVPPTNASSGLLLRWRSHEWKDDPAAMLAECDAILAVHPGSANALHYRARSLAVLGRREEAFATTGFDRFVVVGDLLPEGWDDPQAFHRQLRAEILANDTLRPDPRGKATKGGRQTSTLIRSSNIATPALCDAIRGAVDRYAASLTGDHWFGRGRPSKARLEVWAVVYADEGSQTPHHHPSGWASGVFYVGGAPGADGGGALLMGVPDESGTDPIGEPREIEPRPGRIVIFPSATTHATAPSRPGAERISVAFDVIPLPV